MSIISNIKDIGKHGSIYMLGWAINSAIGLALLPVFTRYLNRSEYGTLAILDSAIELIRILCALGIGSAIIRYYHEYQNEIDRNTVVSTGIVITIILAFLSGVFLYLFRLPLTHVILGRDGSSLFFCMTAATMLIRLVRTAADSYFLALKASKIFVIAFSTQAIVSSGVKLYLVVFQSMGVFGMLLGNLLTAIIINVVLLVVVFRRISFRFDRDILGRLLKFGWPLVISLLAAALMHSMDRFFIRTYVSLSEVGLYSLAYHFPFMLNTVFSGSFERIWGGSSLYTIAKDPDATYQYKRLCTLYMTILGFLLYSVGVAAKTVIGIFAAPEYASAAEYVPIIALGVWLYAFHIFFKTGVLLTKKTHLFSINYSISLMVNFIANLLLVPRLGAMGAALSTVVTYASFSFIGLFIYRNCYALEFEWRKLATIATVGVSLVLLRSMFHFGGFFPIFIVDITAIIAFPVILLTIPGFLSKEEKNSLVSLKEAGFERIFAVFK